MPQPSIFPPGKPYPATVSEINKEIATLQAKRADLIKSLSLSKESVINAAEFLLITYHGRDVAGSQEMGGGYLGCGSFQDHCKQCTDPTSWVHSSLQRWLEVGLMNPPKA